MLVREDDGGVLAIGQQSHAWLSGQLARAWGNPRFGAVEPWEEVCLAAEQHDVGWAPVDLEPRLNRETGCPRSFMEMPLDVHLELWTSGPRALLTQSPYAALLVSMHGWRLYERRELSRFTPREAAAVREFLAEQRAFQEELIARLKADARQLERNSRLIWTWDYISLAACLGWAPTTAKGCPCAAGLVDLEITPGTAPRHLHLNPWPFPTPALTVRCDGRRLRRRFEDEEAMRDALAVAPWQTLEFHLAPR